MIIQKELSIYHPDEISCDLSFSCCGNLYGKIGVEIFGETEYEYIDMKPLIRDHINTRRYKSEMDSVIKTFECLLSLAIKKREELLEPRYEAPREMPK